MKKCLTILVLLCLMYCLSLPVLASDVSYVMDEADLLTDEEELLLEAVCGEGETYGCGIYIVAVEDFTAWGAYTPQGAAENIFTLWELGLGDDADGIMLMLSMAERDYSLICHGYLGNAVFTDAVLDKIIDGFLDNFRRDDWDGGFTDYALASVHALEDYDPGMQSGGEYRQDVPVTAGQKLARMPVRYWLIVIGVPLIAALAVCLLLKRQMRTAGKATHADAYIRGGGAHLTVRQDVYTHTTTRVIHHQRSSGGGSGGGGGGGGGFSGRSGKF